MIEKRPSYELSSLLDFLGTCFQKTESVENHVALARECSRHVRGSERLTASEQVDIYRHQFWLRHLDSLRDDYCTLERLMGTKAFDAFGEAYLSRFPPRTPSLRDLGADIVAFAESYPDFDPNQRALCLELLAYEHLFIDLFDAPEVSPISRDRLVAMGETALTRATLVLSPLLLLRAYSFPVHKMRLAVKASEPIAPLPAPRATTLALFRLDGVIRVDELDPLAFRILHEIAKGHSLTVACEEVARSTTEAEHASLFRELSGWFQRWTQWGFFADVQC